MIRNAEETFETIVYRNNMQSTHNLISLKNGVIKFINYKPILLDTYLVTSVNKTKMIYILLGITSITQNPTSGSSRYLRFLHICKTNINNNNIYINFEINKIFPVFFFFYLLFLKFVKYITIIWD